MHAFYERIRARRGHGIATVAAARKLTVLFWCLLTREKQYAHQQPSLTAKKLRRLELTAGAQKYTKAAAGIWTVNEKMREAERELARQAEASYVRMVQDWHASAPNNKVGASTPATLLEVGGPPASPGRSSAASVLVLVRSGSPPRRTARRDQLSQSNSPDDQRRRSVLDAGCWFTILLRWRRVLDCLLGRRHAVENPFRRALSTSGRVGAGGVSESLLRSSELDIYRGYPAGTLSRSRAGLPSASSGMAPGAGSAVRSSSEAG